MRQMSFFPFVLKTSELLKGLIRLVNRCCQVLWKNLGLKSNQDKT